MNQIWELVSLHRNIDVIILISNKLKTENLYFITDAIKSLVENALTNKINDRDMFMRGIDYSYYYEE